MSCGCPPQRCCHLLAEQGHLYQRHDLEGKGTSTFRQLAGLSESQETTTEHNQHTPQPQQLANACHYYSALFWLE
jgi:hypothetical protein